MNPNCELAKLDIVVKLLKNTAIIPKTNFWQIFENIGQEKTCAEKNPGSISDITYTMQTHYIVRSNR